MSGALLFMKLIWDEVEIIYIMIMINIYKGLNSVMCRDNVRKSTCSGNTEKCAKELYLKGCKLSQCVN